MVLDEGLHRSELIPLVLLPAVNLDFYLMFAIKAVDQWEEAVILRFARSRGLRGSGVSWVIPGVDVLSHLVDRGYAPPM